MSMSYTAMLFFIFSIFLLSNPPSSLAQQQNNQSSLSSSFSFSDSPWRPTDKNRTLISPSSDFAAGFRKLPHNPNLYTFSIWYHKIPQNVSVVVWSANPKSPVYSSGELVITNSGQLFLRNSSTGSENLWPVDASANANTSRSKLILRDDGNLVYDRWQSFSFPTDTILPNQTMKPADKVIVSENGKFRFSNFSKLVFNSSDSYWEAKSAFISLGVDGKMTLANQGAFFCSDFGSTSLRRLTLGIDGNLRIFSFNAKTIEWVIVWQAIHEQCSVHGTCGPNAICMNDGSDSTTSCVCPPGFEPLDGGALEGCSRKIPFDKEPQNTRFLKLDYVNFTGGTNQSLWKAKNYSECESRCLSKPDCQGFLFQYDGKGYCVLQIQQMLYGYWSPGTERAMFLRVHKSEKDETNFIGMTELLPTTCPIKIRLPLPPKDSNSTTRNIVIICTLFAAELIAGGAFFWVFLKKYIKYRTMARTFGLELLPGGGPKRFSYAELKIATNGFSNPIGKGSFGDVYKGELTDHRVVAVKCLKNVTGGDADFWAEVTIIARMHHLNLVRLWGFCAEKGQRILVYEYVPNGSLDKYLFRAGRFEEPNRAMETDALVVVDQKPILDWSIRYRIALGVARAIAYLHEECLEWVLHCDIKPENILLGDDFCPKISDFGLAKLKKKEDMVSLSNMRGTRGYMAPEWLNMDTITSKADVYSFGMVLLELVGGVRNNQMQGSAIAHSEDWYFPAWAFDKVFKEVAVEDILDRQIKDSYDSRAHFDMVNRMVKTAMWCLQSRPEMRPSMGKVAKMIEGTVEIIEPNRPTIFFLPDD